jgi:putative hydrolase of HD superfamily
MKKRNSSRGSHPNGVNAAVNFFAEAGLLKRIKRSGWWVAGIEDPESVAEHCFRTAVMGYFIAHLEGADEARVMAMALFNDIHESRINDLHKMGHYYIDFKDAERKVFRDQVKMMPPSVRRDLENIRREYEQQKTKESLIARDADILECLQQAKEYYDHGHPKAKLFFKRAPDYLKTKTARKIWAKIKTWDSSAWWMNVVKFER